MTIDRAELKRRAEIASEHPEELIPIQMGDFHSAANPQAVLSLLADLERVEALAEQNRACYLYWDKKCKEAEAKLSRAEAVVRAADSLTQELGALDDDQNEKLGRGLEQACDNWNVTKRRSTSVR